MAIQWIIKSRACARALFTGLLRYARNDKGEVRALFTGLLRFARNDKGWGAFYNVSLGYCVPCAYPRICSNCAVACFHILGFIARELCDRGDPVDNKVARMRACINDWIASLRSQ